jgi:hypothetical protein
MLAWLPPLGGRSRRARRLRKICATKGLFAKARHCIMTSVVEGVDVTGAGKRGSVVGRRSGKRPDAMLAAVKRMQSRQQQP